MQVHYTPSPLSICCLSRHSVLYPPCYLILISYLLFLYYPQSVHFVSYTHNCISQDSVVGPHPVSELARFFPDLAPPFLPSQSSPIPPPGASYGFINGQHVPIPTQPASLPNQPTTSYDITTTEPRPASPYYSNMYLARQNLQPSHYPPAPGIHIPPQPQAYHSTPPSTHHSPSPSPSPSPSSSAYYTTPTALQAPVPSPGMHHSTPSQLPEPKSKVKKDK